MSDQETLEELNREYIASVQNCDVKRFGEILSDDFLNTNPDGTLVDKAGFLQQIAPPAKISNLTCHDVTHSRDGRLRHHPRPDQLHAAGRSTGKRSLHGHLGPPQAANGCVSRRRWHATEDRLICSRDWGVPETWGAEECLSNSRSTTPSDSCV